MSIQVFYKHDLAALLERKLADAMKDEDSLSAPSALFTLILFLCLFVAYYHGWGRASSIKELACG